jgi:hypothetical protein
MAFDDLHTILGPSDVNRLIKSERDGEVDANLRKFKRRQSVSQILVSDESESGNSTQSQIDRRTFIGMRMKKKFGC